MHQYKAENAQTNPKSTINSYRSFGYNLSAGIADIVDNSISANAKKNDIDYKWNGKDSFISIIDNGNGMNLEELVIAMTPGSKDPDEVRNENDLGRFGMGLKTASFSQCKRLTVTKTVKDIIEEINLQFQLEIGDEGVEVVGEFLDQVAHDKILLSIMLNNKNKDAEKVYNEIIKEQLTNKLVDTIMSKSPEKYGDIMKDSVLTYINRTAYNVLRNASNRA
jgi:hypothetical protein